LRRVIRTCAIAKYTHIFLETLGNVAMDCLKELLWPGTFLKEKGFDVLCCPWDNDDNLNGCICTVKEQNQPGVIKTTRNRLFAPRGIPSILYFGLGASGDADFEKLQGHVGLVLERSMAVYRKTGWGVQGYERAGRRKTSCKRVRVDET